jgi:hypothetical protein
VNSRQNGTCYIQNIIGVGIRLQEQAQIPSSGREGTKLEFSVKNIYQAIAEVIWKNHDETWRKRLWKWNCPLENQIIHLVIGREQNPSVG